ncbi:MAG: N-acetylmuramoyl-L-alanine amidase, partial [Anaerovoracaceae bacterium]
MKGKYFFYIYLAACIFTSIPCLAQTNKDKFVLVIDPGHGGRDSGALGVKTKEKTINLNVSLMLGKLIEQNFDDVKVVYTRKTDVAVELKQRAAIANQAKADLFISIHTNSLDKR